MGSLVHRDQRYAVWQEDRPLRRARFYFGTQSRPYRYYEKSWYVTAKATQQSEPVRLHEHDGSVWWWFQEAVYRESAGLTAADVRALVLQATRSREKALARAHAELRGENEARQRRQPIPEAVRHEVWRRDQGRCVDCGSREQLEFDHIIPVSEGGSSTARNLELRCAVCNGRKSDQI